MNTSKNLYKYKQEMIIMHATGTENNFLRKVKKFLKQQKYSQEANSKSIQTKIELKKENFVPMY